MLVVYTWYLFALLLVHDVRPRRYPAYGGEKIAVMIPCYNEDPELVEEAIRSVLAAHGLKQVIVIDDGSTNGVQERLRELAAELPITLHEFARTRQARGAALRDEAPARRRRRLRRHDRQRHAPRAHALVRVVEPLFVADIGASTGNVLLLNERQNLLTRMIGTYYWIGLNIYKQAQSVIRSVVCCSGCLAAYRADLLREVIDEFAASASSASAARTRRTGI